MRMDKPITWRAYLCKLAHNERDSTIRCLSPTPKCSQTDISPNGCWCTTWLAALYSPRLTHLPRPFATSPLQACSIFMQAIERDWFSCMQESGFIGSSSAPKACRSASLSNSFARRIAPLSPPCVRGTGTHKPSNKIRASHASTHICRSTAGQGIRSYWIRQVWFLFDIRHGPLVGNYGVTAAKADLELHPKWTVSEWSLQLRTK